MKKNTGNFNMFQEQINNIVNTNALLIALNKKGIINAKEFVDAKEEAIKEFRKDFPELFENK